MTAALTSSSPPTERRSTRSLQIDRMNSLDLLTLINEEDSGVPGAVRAVLLELARVVDRAVADVERGGRIHYFGAGTSGRFGVLDAAEVPPTYGVSPELFSAHLAGGTRAMLSAVEDAEDSELAGAEEAALSVRAGDVVVGLAASGHTPYVAGALAEARRRGAFTVAITSNPDASLAAHADAHLCVDTGQEVITGSTRMKAGTAQKLVLHSFSTALMVRLGHTFSNLMIGVVPTNAKLRRRVVRLLRQASGATDAAAEAALAACDGDVKSALLMLLADLDAATARSELAEGNGDVRSVLDDIRTRTRGAAPGTSWLGIDIGASGFRVALLEGDHLHDDERGADRPAIDGTGVRVDRILPGIAAKLEQLRRAGAAQDMDAVVIGLAGSANFPGRSESLAREIRELTGARLVAVTADIVPAYVGALGVRPGAVLAAGTGAVALGSDLQTVLRRVDGLGHLLGDHGSGAWIGRRALECAAASRAGRPESSPLLSAALRERFGSIEDLVKAVYGGADRSAILASFVPDVLAAAADGDVVASGILDDAADALALTLGAAGSGIEGPIAAVGGLVSPDSALRGRLEQRVALTPALSSAAQGAAIMARSLRRGTLPALLIRDMTTVEED